MQSFSGREEAEAGFKIERPEVVARSEGFGEGFPVDGLNSGVAPAKTVVEVAFEQA
jgi:hypothetical protein